MQDLVFTPQERQELYFFIKKTIKDYEVLVDYFLEIKNDILSKTYIDKISILQSSREKILNLKKPEPIN